MIWQVPTSNAERIEDQKIDLPLNSLSIPFGFVYVYNAFKFEGRTIFFINSFSMGVGICYVIKLH